MKVRLSLAKLCGGWFDECDFVLQDWDCEKYNPHGEHLGDQVCPVSCGRCKEVPDEIFTDQLCYEHAKKTIDVKFTNL